MRYIATISYISFILIINICFSYLPSVHFSGNNVISVANILVGFIYLARDFAQREIGHYVLLAMAVGATLSYWLADRAIALASLAAFLIAESFDWGIFTLTRWPLSKRLLLSASISAPIDTYVFLHVAQLYNHLEFTVMTVAKLFGVLLLWWTWWLRTATANQRLQPLL